MSENLFKIGQNKGTIKGQLPNPFNCFTPSWAFGVSETQKTMLEKAQCPEVIKSYEASP